MSRPQPAPRTFGQRLGSRLDSVIAPFFPGLALRRQEARTRLVMASGTQYRGAEMGRLFGDWILGVDTSTPTSYELATLRDRCRDLCRNDGVAAGAADTIALNVAGSGLRPQSRLRAERLGITPERAAEIQRQMEAVWDLWCAYADASNMMQFEDLQFLMVRKLVEDGEVLALPLFADETWRPLGRCVQLLECDRLGGGATKDFPAHGVKLGPRGEPTAYSIRRAGDAAKYETIEARDAQGRPKVIHLFIQRRPGQVRGVPLFAPVIAMFKHLTDYREARVVAARVAACLAVFITRNPDMANPADYAGGTTAGTAPGDAGGTTSERVQSLKPGMLGYLEAGEGVQVVDPIMPADGDDAFVTGALRYIGMGLGLPYELTAKDFSKCNYSSARAAVLEGRRMFTNWRGVLGRRGCQPIWELVQEEAVARGMVDIPYATFMAARSEWCRAQWIGGGWGWVDPVKEVESSLLAIRGGLSTQAEECAAQGRDWEEVNEQQQRERADAKARGLDYSASSATKPAAPAPGDNPDDNPDDSRDGGQQQ